MNARAPAIRQSAITRAIKAAQAAGLTVSEVVATRDGFRVVTQPIGLAGNAAIENPWDRCLDDAAKE